MSKLNINKNEWLELVFEGKNKAYGAYQLRQEDGRTTVKAFLISLLFLGSLVGLGALFSSFTDAPVIIQPIVDTITPVRFDPITETETEKVEPIEIPQGKPLDEPETIDLVNPTIVDAAKADDTPLTENEDLGKTKSSEAEPGGKGDGFENGTVTGPVIPKENAPTVGYIDDGRPKNPSEVDQNPNYPGGIKRFLETVGQKFVAPSLDEERVVKVIVFFVVEKDGTLSNIKFARDPGFGVGEEAVRVLKSIKTKWEPGKIKGQPVRTSFSLPITVNITGNN